MKIYDQTIPADCDSFIRDNGEHTHLLTYLNQRKQRLIDLNCCPEVIAVVDEYIKRVNDWEPLLMLPVA
jgi:hypothetical protein